MGRVVKGPWRNPSAKEKLEREIVVLRELIEAYRVEQTQKRAAHAYAPSTHSDPPRLFLARLRRRFLARQRRQQDEASVPT
jgi:hypothetical protein